MDQVQNTLNPQCAGITATSATAICHCVGVGSLAQVQERGVSSAGVPGEAG